MNICYVLYRENIFSPLVESQVLNNLYKISKKSVNIHFIWLKRIDYYLRYKDDIEKTKSRMKNNGIVLHEIPIIVGKFPLGEAMSDFVFYQTRKKIINIIKDNDIDLVHTRGYDAGYLITRIRSHDSMSFFHVFDPRSPFLTEIQSTYGVKKNDNIYSFWKRVEREIVSNANVTVAISKMFYNYLKQYNGKIDIIPNNSEMDTKESVINRINENGRNSLCFVGSLGYGWNNVKEYILFMKKVWDEFPDIFFEFYLLNQEIALKEFKEAGFSPQKYLIKTIPQNEVTRTISGCIAGLQIMSRPDSRLGIKTVDYLAAGVPVICNNNAQGAATIIGEYGVGWNIDEKSISEVLIEAKNNTSLRIKSYEIAYSNFSTDVVSELYFRLYKKIIENKFF